MSYLENLTIPAPPCACGSSCECCCICDERTCWVCGESAQYVDLCFEAPVCGGTCIWAAWEAMRLHDTKWRAW